MAKEDVDVRRIRSRLVELLEADDWQMSDRARAEGLIALKWVHDRAPRETEMIDYIISMLNSNTILRCAPQGDPPGSTGIAWQMTDQHNVFVKLQIREKRMGEEYAFIQSIHESVHQRKASED